MNEIVMKLGMKNDVDLKDVGQIFYGGELENEGEDLV